VQQLRRGQHACLLYDKQDDPLAIVAPFVAVGLEAGERCVYVVGEQEPARIESSLEAAGIDVTRQIERGALVLLSRWEVSFPNGEFDPAAMIGFVRQTINQTQVLIDPLRIEQVLVNLLDNARKYSPPGTRIEVELSSEPDAITLAVRDHGHGIPAEEHERVFERFHRLRQEKSGVGLGLHISRELVRMHGGELRVETPANGGTRFIARLPRTVAAESPGRTLARS
jgi:signal transduction histidine kinase